MLGGLEPIIIFSFFKKVSTADEQKLSKLPIAKFVNSFALPPIPIYLSESATGLFIDSKQKSIDIETSVDALASGASPDFNQKPINSVLKINLVANENSLGLNILSALADLILPKVVSAEYSITFLSGSTVMFGALLHSLSISQEANTTLQQITLELVNTSKKTSPVNVEKTPGAATLNNTGPIPAGAPTSGGASTPPPSIPLRQP